MSVKITIRNVPEEVRDNIAALAAIRRQSMQKYLLGELNRIAFGPPVDVWLEQVRERKAAMDMRIPASNILRERDADRA